MLHFGTPAPPRSRSRRTHHGCGEMELAVWLLLITVGCSEALKFITEPADVVVAAGDSVLLPCSGSLAASAALQQHQRNGKGGARAAATAASSAPTITWRGPDGQDIGIVDTFRAQSLNGSLYITSLEEHRGLTGSYQCVLHAEGVGTIVSRAARVTIAKLPELYGIFRELNVLVGQTAYFKCLAGAQADHGLRYKVGWFKDEVLLSVDESRMTVFDSGALEIDAVRATDAGTYQCQVTAGAVSKVSSKFNLNVGTASDPPLIDVAAAATATAAVQHAPLFLTDATAALSVRDGDAVTLECCAVGVPRPQTKWLRNGVDIDLSDLDSRFRLVGTGSLHIARVDESDAGNYQCRAGNVEDTLDAQVALEVQVPPRLIEQPTDRVAQVKEELELVCAMRGRPTPVVQWLKNGDLIRPNDYMQVVNGHNLRILGLIESDAGMFQCVAANPAGSVQASARLQIAQPASSPSSGGKVPKKTKGGTKKTQQRTKTSNEPSSAPPPPQRTTTKTLSKNMFESLRGGTAKRSKQRPPPPPLEPMYLDDANENQGDDDDGGDDDDDEDDDDDADGEYDLNYDADGGGGSAGQGFNRLGFDADDAGTIHPFGPHVDATKLLNTLTHMDGGGGGGVASAETSESYGTDFNPDFKRKLFSTVARTSDGALSGSGGGGVKPGPPRDLVAQIINPRFVALSWMEPAVHPDEVTSYTVYYRMTTSERERKITTKTRDDQMANIQALQPGKTYLFRVVGNSAAGAGESSPVFAVSTQPEENISGPPLDVQGEAISDSVIRVQWKQPLVTNGNISKYRIYYTELDGTDLYTDSQTLEALLLELRPFTEYTISVVPFNLIGMGDPSNELIVQTYTATPREPPTNVTVETSSSTSLLIRWEPPSKEDRNGPITGYKIRYRQVKASVKSPVQVEMTPGNSRHLELTGLEKMAAYQVKIAAMTVNGTGPFTDWSLVETLENDLTETQVPGDPAFLRTKPKATSIIVSWGAPTEQPDIKVRSYILSWGLGIPDVDRLSLNENARFYEITDLQPNAEYVISLRAQNRIGDGKPRYDYVSTRDEEPLDVPAALEVPVGLRAITLTAGSIVVYWTDTTLNRNQQVVDNRHYTVRYNLAGTSRYRYLNTTDLNYMLGDLRPNSQYEFAVKVVKGRRESAWSMSVLNSTAPALQLSAPRELHVRADPEATGAAAASVAVTVAWQPVPVDVSASGQPQASGYLVYYTTDTTLRDRDWMMVPVAGGETGSVRIANLKPYTTYYFKAQLRTARNALGPFSMMAQHTTGAVASVLSAANGGGSGADAATVHNHGTLGGGAAKLSGELLIYVVAGVSALVILIAVVVLAVLCRRKPVATPEHAKQSYLKSAAAIKPPDLWIHHDQMELKNVDGGGGGGGGAGNGVTVGPGGVVVAKGHTGAAGSTPGYSDGASSSGAMTLPRSVNHGDFEHESASAAGGGSHVTNSLDKRSYVPGYMTTSMNSMERPSYPRTQYTSRVVPPHIVSCDPSAATTLSQQNLMQSGGSMNGQQTPDLPYGYDSMPSNYSNPNVTYAPGMSVDAPKRGQGHPLKSFSVPGPPSTQQLLPNQPKHNVPAVTIRPQNASPYKKSTGGPPASSAAPGSGNRLQQSGPSVAHSNDEVQRLAPSTSTEELNQEMANLEGLMKDLSAITANEFEC